jgi:predicted CXXCH cytochrome family protein
MWVKEVLVPTMIFQPRKRLSQPETISLFFDRGGLSEFSRLAFGLALMSAWCWGCDSDGDHRSPAPTNHQAKVTLAPKEQPSFVSRSACGGCHQAEVEAWSTSHHARSMAEAGPTSIVGDLSKKVQSGVKEPKASLKRSGETFVVTTEGRTGKIEDFRVRYTFGFHPLQQYLVDGDRGRLQPLRLSWDNRSASEGGQRWFHQYPEEDIPVGDLLHWTGANQNYNGMCADCHSTDLRRGYDAPADSFSTTWKEIEVSCEACHGPASAHLKWANLKMRPSLPASGFELSLVGASGGSWRMNNETGIAELQAENSRKSGTAPFVQEVHACAACHSRRSLLREDPRPPAEFLDLATPEFALSPSYYPDGQILEEVYVWGSFTQSKMHAAGVTCSNCHEPHSGRLRAEGNALCAQCHSTSKYDAPSHHFHRQFLSKSEEGARSPISQKGVECVSCHMPVRTYMGVDERHDHSLRVPAPHLSVEFGVPNACTGCHENKSAEWTAEAVEKLWGKPSLSAAEILCRGQVGDPSAISALLELAKSEKHPIMQRSSALVVASRLTVDPRPLVALLEQLKSHKQALIRLSVAQSSGAIPPDAQIALLGALLGDPSRAVRAEAMRLLVTTFPREATKEISAKLTKVVDETVAEQQVFLDRPSVRTELAALAQGMGDAVAAELHYEAALIQDPDFVPAAINYADFLRRVGRDQEGFRLLSELKGRVVDASAVWHAIGLFLVREKRYADALLALAEAAKLEPNNAQYALTFAVALDAQGEAVKAVRAVESGLEASPWSFELLQYRVSLLVKGQAKPRVEAAVAEWIRRYPNHPQAIEVARQTFAK